MRFKDFKDDWENKKINDLYDVNTGKSKYKKEDVGNYKVLGSVGVVGQSNSYDYNGNFVLIARVGAYAGSLYMYSGKVKITDNTIFINTDSHIFAYLLLKHRNLNRLVFGSGQPLIKSSELQNLTINVPETEKEQRQIGLFFNKIDNLIDLKVNKLASLERLKRGYLQKIFTDLTENKPKLRFKGFNDDWKEVELKEIGNIVTGNTPPKNNKDNYYNGSYTWVTPTDINTDENYIYDSDTKLSRTGYDKSRKVPENSILVTCIASIGKNAITGKTVSFNQQINALVPNDNYYPYFIYTLSSFWSLAMKKITSNVSLKLVNKNDFSQLKTKVPNYKEQSKIGAAMKLIDKQINLQRKELDRLKSLKKGYLQKMFV